MRLTYFSSWSIWHYTGIMACNPAHAITTQQNNHLVPIIGLWSQCKYATDLFKTAFITEYAPYFPHFWTDGGNWSWRSKASPASDMARKSSFSSLSFTCMAWGSQISFSKRTHQLAYPSVFLFPSHPLPCNGTNAFFCQKCLSFFKCTTQSNWFPFQGKQISELFNSPSSIHTVIFVLKFKEATFQKTDEVWIAFSRRSV